jgi:hypothetical protein
MKVRQVAAIAALAAATLAGSASAAEQTPDAAIPGWLVGEIREWAAAPVVMISIRAQNEKNADVDQATIDRLDQQWRAETEAAEKPLIAQVLGSPLSGYLTRIKAQGMGLYSEIFIIDAKGLNVGQSSVTSDYWQGDEDKWLKTYAMGPGAIHIGEVEYNEATRSHRVQISLTITDPETGAPVGSITTELDLDEAASREQVASR